MRVGVGYLIQETNSFSPVKTRLEDFSLIFGRDVITQWKGTKTEIAGFCDVLTEAHHEVVPLFAGWAITAGPIFEAEFEQMKSVILNRINNAGKLDGMLLALHGAMCAERTDDCEGTLLRLIREVRGRDLPILLTLDLHANITQQLITETDAVIGYRTYPHIDTYEIGRECAHLLLRILRKEVRPVTVMQKIPLIVPAENMQTTHGPMAEIFSTGEEFRTKHREILCVSVFGVQPWLDIEEMGAGIVVVADQGASVARNCATEVAQKFWDLRHVFEVELVSPHKAIELALATPGKPIILSESSDSPTAGSPGDSAALLQALIQHAPGVPAAAWVRDQAAVAQAWERMPGARLETLVGGTLDRKFRSPVPVTAVIRSLTDGRFTFRGAWNKGMQIGMGRTAVVDVGQISLILSEAAVSMIDPEVYRSQGIEPRDKKIVVVKSANGFRSQYEPFAAKIIMVDTPGICSPNLRSLPYRRISRPIYPLDPIEFKLQKGRVQP